MAIRKREPIDQAKIEAFGEAADAPLSSGTSASNASITDEAAGQEEVKSVPKTFLIRWGDDVDLAAEISALAKIEDRSQHKTLLRVLRRGVEVMKNENR